jgi:hypothetical protein
MQSRRSASNFLQNRRDAERLDCVPTREREERVLTSLVHKAQIYQEG